MNKVNTSTENITRIIDDVTTHCSQPSEYGLLLPGPLVEIVELVEALVVEREFLRAAWLRMMQEVNECVANGICVNKAKCGCVAELNALIQEAKEISDE